MNKQSDESKLLWMRDSLDKIVAYLNKKYPDLHIFTMVTIRYDGETWGGYIHPFFLTDTNRCQVDRIILIRNYRTDTFEELINQMMETVKFQDDVYESQLTTEGDFIGD